MSYDLQGSHLIYPAAAKVSLWTVWKNVSDHFVLDHLFQKFKCGIPSVHVSHLIKVIF